MDVAQFRHPDEYGQSLTAQGEYVPIGHAHYDDGAKKIFGDVPRFVGLMIKTMTDAEKRKSFKIPKKHEVLEILRDHLQSGKLTPVVGRTFGLGEVVEAMRCMQRGDIGRMIITP